MIDEKRIKRFIEGAKEAFKEVDDPTFTFPMNILSAYELATSIEELLKAQEPRVMTLEEVQQMGKRNMEYNDLPYETCICEVKTRRGLHICSPFWNEPRFEGDESHLEIQFEYMGTDEYDNVPVKKYEWYIRCWTSRPTDEQRRATPWPS